MAGGFSQFWCWELHIAGERTLGHPFHPSLTISSYLTWLWKYRLMKLQKKPIFSHFWRILLYEDFVLYLKRIFGNTDRWHESSYYSAMNFYGNVLLEAEGIWDLWWPMQRVRQYLTLHAWTLLHIALDHNLASHTHTAYIICCCSEILHDLFESYTVQIYCLTRCIGHQRSQIPSASSNTFP